MTEEVRQPGRRPARPARRPRAGRRGLRPAREAVWLVSPFIDDGARPRSRRRRRPTRASGSRLEDKLVADAVWDAVGGSARAVAGRSRRDRPAPRGDRRAGRGGRRRVGRRRARGLQRGRRLRAVGASPGRTPRARSASSPGTATGCGSCRSSRGCRAASTASCCPTAPRCSGPSSWPSCVVPAAGSCSAGWAPRGTRPTRTVSRCGTSPDAPASICATSSATAGRSASTGSSPSTASGRPSSTRGCPPGSLSRACRRPVLFDLLQLNLLAGRDPGVGVEALEAWALPAHGRRAFARAGAVSPRRVVGGRWTADVAWDGPTLVRAPSRPAGRCPPGPTPPGRTAVLTPDDHPAG